MIYPFNLPSPTGLSQFWEAYGGYLSLIAVISIILFVFWVLLAEKFEEKRRIILSLFLLIVGLGFGILSPLPKEFNSVLITALFTPIIGLIVNILRTKQKFSNEVDKTSYDYRCKQVERESDTIGELLGELSSHAATFQAYGLRELDSQKWTSAYKVGLISDFPTLSFSKYYYFVPVYNQIIREISELVKQRGAEEVTNLFKLLAEVKKAYFNVEEALYLSLSYDLGMLQQRYYARPAVKFPVHMTLILRKRLVNCGILTKSDRIEFDENELKDIFNAENSSKFSLDVTNSFKRDYAALSLDLKAIEKEIAVIKTKVKK